VRLAAAIGLSAGVVQAAGAADPVAASGPVLEPVIELTQGQVSGCGLRVGFATATHTVEFVNRRTGPATEFLLTAVRVQPGQPAAALSLKTGAYDTRTLLPPARMTRDGEREMLTAQGTMDPTTGAFLMRELMLSGARVTWDLQNAQEVSLDIPGPLSQSIRAAYLQCAGDLFPQTLRGLK
jgi:hypothetical protein